MSRGGNLPLAGPIQIAAVSSHRPLLFFYNPPAHSSLAGKEMVNSLTVIEKVLLLNSH